MYNYYMVCYVYRDIKTLARAAVGGDESALDMFTWKKGKPNNKMSALLGSDSQGFFLGCDNGELKIIAMAYFIIVTSINKFWNEICETNSD